MGFFKGLKKDLKKKIKEARRSSQDEAPPGWSAAPETSYMYGKYNEAPEDEYDDAEAFCDTYPPSEPALLPSAAVDRINAIGCKAWGMEAPKTPRFVGHIQNASDAKGGPAVTTVTTKGKTLDTCLLSDLPIVGGLYDTQGKSGVYFEIMVQKMDGFIGIGTAVRPYPFWRQPGWNRLSAGFHLDDLRKFFEDGDGGMDYESANRMISKISPGDTIGCGFEFATGDLFYTYNGHKLSTAFTGLYFPRSNYDVYAAVGVQGASQFQVNFGGELFRWKEGNEWAWRVEGHVGRLGSGSGGDELPSYGSVA